MARDQVAAFSRIGSKIDFRGRARGCQIGAVFDTPRLSERRRQLAAVPTVALTEFAGYFCNMQRYVPTVFLVVLALNTGWFVVYSGYLGLSGLVSQAPGEVSRVFQDAGYVANIGIALHMLAGAILTCGAPLQALPIVRHRWPTLHRRFGYVLCALAIATGFGGLVYIALNGTVGGSWMSFWFAVYGIAIIWSAFNTVYYALAKDLCRHFAWAVRLIILAVGSWIYRMHYVIWYAGTGGLTSEQDFTGLFDRIQVFAFFVPYLLIAEIALRWSNTPRRHRST